MLKVYLIYYSNSIIAIPASRRMDGFDDEDEQLTDEQKHAKIRGTPPIPPFFFHLPLPRLSSFIHDNFSIYTLQNISFCHVYSFH